jgi:hypothetical protein
VNTKDYSKIHLDFYKGTIEINQVRKMYQKNCGGSGYYVCLFLHYGIVLSAANSQFNLDCRNRVYELYVDRIEDMKMWMKYIAIIRTGKLREVQEVFATSVTVSSLDFISIVAVLMLRKLNGEKNFCLRTQLCRLNVAMNWPTQPTKIRKSMDGFY